jgi:hypothetical protein
MKPTTKPKVTGTKRTAQAAGTGTSGAARGANTASSKHQPLILTESGTKENFIKKLQLCSKTFDYHDETKDVRGKVGSNSFFLFLHVSS